MGCGDALRNTSLHPGVSPPLNPSDDVSWTLSPPFPSPSTDPSLGRPAWRSLTAGRIVPVNGQPEPHPSLRLIQTENLLAAATTGLSPISNCPFPQTI